MLLELHTFHCYGINQTIPKEVSHPIFCNKYLSYGTNNVNTCAFCLIPHCFSFFSYCILSSLTGTTLFHEIKETILMYLSGNRRSYYYRMNKYTKTNSFSKNLSQTVVAPRHFPICNKYLNYVSNISRPIGQKHMKTHAFSQFTLPFSYFILSSLTDNKKVPFYI